jgi:hypothetical protein
MAPRIQCIISLRSITVWSSLYKCSVRYELIIYIYIYIYVYLSIKNNMMDGACGTCGGEWRCIQGIGGDIRREEAT